MLFYDSELLEPPSRTQTTLPADIHQLFNNEELPVIFSNIEPGGEQRHTNSFSWFNSKEIIQVMRYLNKLIKSEIKTKEIGIITPYKAQVKLGFISNLYSEGYHTTLYVYYLIEMNSNKGNQDRLEISKHKWYRLRYNRRVSRMRKRRYYSEYGPFKSKSTEFRRSYWSRICIAQKTNLCYIDSVRIIYYNRY